jgi:hypothetical protein
MYPTCAACKSVAVVSRVQAPQNTNRTERVPLTNRLEYRPLVRTVIIAAHHALHYTIATTA